MVSTSANNVISYNNDATDGSGGGIYCDDAAPTIRDNTIEHNKASNGGGIYCSGLNRYPEISHNTISDNESSRGAGIYAACDGLPTTIVRNTISDNTATQRGGGIWCSDNASIRDNWITDNAAYLNDYNISYGGGIYAEGYSSSSTRTPSILNNTITDNTTSPIGFGGGIYWGNYCGPIISNNIVYSNSRYGIYRGQSPVVAPYAVLRYNCAFANSNSNYGATSGTLSPGTGSISQDPEVTDGHISNTSVCFDAGYDDDVPEGDADLDGESRIRGDHVDMGADECAP